MYSHSLIIHKSVGHKSIEFFTPLAPKSLQPVLHLLQVILFLLLPLLLLLGGYLRGQSVLEGIRSLAQLAGGQLEQHLVHLGLEDEEVGQMV